MSTSEAVTALATAAAAARAVGSAAVASLLFAENGPTSVSLPSFFLTLSLGAFLTLERSLGPAGADARLTGNPSISDVSFPGPSECTHTRPPCASTITLANAMPRPDCVPPPVPPPPWISFGLNVNISKLTRRASAG